MKNLICGLFITLSILPQAVSAATPHEQYLTILKNFITILVWQRDHLEQTVLQNQFPVFAQATTQALTAAATTSSRALRRGGSSRRPDIVVPATSTPPTAISVTGELNTFQVNSLRPIALSRMILDLATTSPDFLPPAEFVVTAELAPAGFYDVYLTYNAETEQYESEDLTEYLANSERWEGSFEVVIPEELLPYYFTYTVRLSLPEVYTVDLVNPGLPNLEVITDSIAVNDFPYTPAKMPMDIILWPILFNNNGDGPAFIETMTLSVENDQGEELNNIFTNLRLEDDQGRVVNGVFDDAKVVFSGLALAVAGKSSVPIQLKADFVSREQDISFIIKVEMADISVYDIWDNEYFIPEGYYETDTMRLVQSGLRFGENPRTLEIQWLDPEETQGEYILTLPLRAVGRDYFITTAAREIGDGGNTGARYVVNGEYGDGLVEAELTVESEAISDQLYRLPQDTEVQVMLTLHINSTIETAVSVEWRQLWYSESAEDTTSAAVIEFAPGEFETASLTLQPVP